MNKEILKYCFKEGILLDNEVLNLLNEANDLAVAKLLISKIKEQTQQKIITKETFYNKEVVEGLFSGLPSQNRNLEKLKIKLGLSIEISKETQQPPQEIIKVSKDKPRIKVLSSTPPPLNQRIEVNDFVTHFRNRFLEMRVFLQDHQGLDNLVSINKISGSKHNLSVIGLVSERKITKNKNLIFEVEDLTGKIRILVRKDKKELYERAEEIALDSVIGIKGSGNREIIFVNELALPGAHLPRRKNSPQDESILFIGDLHFGSKRFLEKSFKKFIRYLSDENSEDPEVAKINYLFIVGDVVTGVGNYPNQERDLLIKDLEEQFSGFAELLKEIRRDIKIIISPGNHDGVRLMEPQPIFDEKFAWALHEMENVILVENPSYLNIGSVNEFSGFDVLAHHGFSLPYYANSVPRLLSSRAMNTPEEIMKYILVNRHLAPTHASAQYFPLNKDPLIIRVVPDILFLPILIKALFLTTIIYL